jgi:hypothetical protein
MADYTYLETLLDDTLTAIKSGDLTWLADLSLRAETAFATQGNCGRDLAKRLQSKAKRNERLLAAAIKGVKAARQRVSDFSSAGRFSTYDAGGQRDQVGVPTGARTQRF